MPDTEAHRAGAALAAARERRIGLHRALVAVEAALAAAAAADRGEWLTRVFATLVDLRDAFADHVRVVEATEGVLPAALEAHPRLQHEVDVLTAEHDTIAADLDAALASVHQLAGEGAGAVRERILTLVLAMARHRQRGADLVYEAFSVDIGGSD